MTLSALIKKGGLARSATVTPATIATQQAGQASSVAAVATVTVTMKPESSIEPNSEPASTELTTDEESKIRAWLTHIEETDSEIIAEVVDKCRSDNGVLVYFLRRAGEVRNFAYIGTEGIGYRA
ncbi:MAG: hypothetical protein IZT60_08230 [Gammaproteobacteria bacterium]|nr:hypothetical protein [Gammaproteobacteria bacterium]